LQGILF